MAGEYERLIEDVARELWLTEGLRARRPRGTKWEDEGDNTHDTYRPLARAAIALIAERTKEANASACIDVDHAGRMGGIWTPKSIWQALHLASALWPPRGEETK